MKLVTLHLSDIHFKSKEDVAYSYADSIGRASIPRIRDADGVLILITGDIAYSGTREQYDVAEDFIQSIAAVVRRETEGEVFIALCQGNHDCDFSGNQDIRDTLIEKVQKEGASAISATFVDECTKVQSAFFEFRKRVCPDVQDDDPLWARYKHVVGGYSIAIECPNVAWMSQRKETQGVLIFPAANYETLKSERFDLRIVSMHHPFNWFSQATYREFRKLVRSVSHVVLTGHEHESNSGEILDQESGHSCFIEAGAISPDEENTIPSLTLIEIDFDAQQYLAEIHVLNDGMFVPLESASWNSYRPLPEKTNAGLSITQNFRNKIDDPGANFSHPSKANLQLSDIYIYPDLRHSADGDNTFRDTMSSGTLRNKSNISKGVIVKGEESSGKTSLLYQLFASYFDQGALPIYLNGIDLKPSEKDMTSSIEKAIVLQYGESSKNVIIQSDKSKIVYLVDDFDLINVAGKHREKIVDYLSRRASAIVITASPLFDIEEAIQRSSSSLLVEMKEYEILEFGHKLRFDLIHKWSSIGEAVGRSSRELIKEIDTVEKAITAILGKNMVSSSPLYILTMLQTQEAGKIASDLQTTGFGEYYKMLITKSFGKAGVRARELLEYHAFCSAFAWELCEKGSHEVTKDEFEEISNKYSSEYHRRDFTERLRVLLEAKILQIFSGGYSFSYPYLYYYYLGKHIGDRVIYDPPVEKKFIHYCDHLYVKDYGNTILFAAYHNPGPKIYEAVARVLSLLFLDKSPLDLAKDTAQLVNLISHAPMLTYSDSDVIENRRNANEARDKVDTPSSARPLTSQEAEDPHLGLASRLNLLFKTVDILGQILKNQYATIDAKTKERLLIQAFDGPMRALADFIEFVEKNPDALILEIERAISKKSPDMSESDRKRMATEVAFFFISTICFAFIYKPMLSVTSEHLMPLISSLSKKSGSGSYKLIEVAGAMEIYNDIPFKLLGEVARQSRGNPYMEHILKRIGLHYLYRFKTRDKDKQKLCADLEIPMDSQRIIDMKTRNSKED